MSTLKVQKLTAHQLYWNKSELTSPILSITSTQLSLKWKLNWQNMNMKVFFCQFDILTSLFWWLFWHLQIITNIDISYSLGFCTLHIDLLSFWPKKRNNWKFLKHLKYFCHDGYSLSVLGCRCCSIQMWIKL